MQCNLKAMFAGKREAVELPPKPRMGRPPKVRNKEEEAETPDPVLEALQSRPDQPEAYYDLLPRRRPCRIPKVRIKEEEAEMPDVLLEALQSLPGDPKAHYESLPVRRRKRTADCMDDEAWAVCHRLG